MSEKVLKTNSIVRLTSSVNYIYQHQLDLEGTWLVSLLSSNSPERFRTYYKTANL